jgi:hypothetical protein
LRSALTAPQPKSYGAIIDAKGAGELLRAIDGYEGHIVTKLAMHLVTGWSALGRLVQNLVGVLRNAVGNIFWNQARNRSRDEHVPIVLVDRR